MRRIDYRIIIGLVLVIGGLLALLDQLGILRGATNFFWAAVLGAGAVLFLVWFFSDNGRWWAAIPGFGLAGLAISNLLPDQAGWGGLAFLGGLGTGFWAIYLARRRQWWAIIPGGVLITLGITSVLDTVYSAVDTGGILLIGLGLTFLLLGLLERMRWAYIPAAALFLIGFFIGVPFAGAFQYVWAGLILLAGVILLISAIRR